MNVAIIGAQWGDEGKGKVVDLYSAQADMIVRSQGGNNAGHTLVVNGQKTVLHIIPSGILHPGKRCLIGNGVVFDANVFFEEVETLARNGIQTEGRLQVSNRATIIMPYHRMLDKLREEYASRGSAGSKIGTTMRGIGPAYEDKVARRGIHAVDLLTPELLKRKLEAAVEEKNVLYRHHFNAEPINTQALLDEYLKIGQKLRPYLTDVHTEVNNAIRKGQKVLFEGAQGVLLDVDFGTYPFVTSSNTISGGLLTGTGVGPRAIHNIIGITKAYTTRVGTGPFPSELEHTDKPTAERIRAVGKEFGATTGRPRRCGWLDLVALKYAVDVSGLTGLAITKPDVLNGFKEVKLCTAYTIDGQKVTEYPPAIDDLEKAQPVFESHEGWPSIDAQGSFEELPKALQRYLKRIEQFVGVPIVLVSTGPDRAETLTLCNPFI